MSKIEVGTKILMQIAGMKDRLHSFFVGYIKKRCVIVMMPMVPEMNRSLLLEYVYKGNNVTVRFIQSGAVFGFESAILHFSFSPIPLIFLEYPESIESHNLRKDFRVSCLFPVSATFKGQELKGVLANISQSGGQVFFQNITHEGLEMDIDDSLHFKSPSLFLGQDVIVPSIIKRIHKDFNKLELGLKFTGLSAEAAAHIDDYIQQTLLFAEGS